MTARRDFLKTAGGAALAGTALEGTSGLPATVLQDARQLIRSGRLGRVGFCRVAHPSLLPAVAFVLGGGARVSEVNAGTDGIVFLGSRATLAVDQHGWRLFARETKAPHGRPLGTRSCQPFG